VAGPFDSASIMLYAFEPSAGGALESSRDIASPFRDRVIELLQVSRRRA
jgi:hypothetical protein